MSRSVLPLLVLAAMQATFVWAGDLVVNGSFEEGTDAPRGWTAEQGGRWTTNAETSHHGRRCLTGSRGTAGSVWHSDPLQLETGVDYRLEGWLSCRSGKAWIEAVFGDPRSNPRQSVATPPVVPGGGWQYVALELGGRDAKTVRFEFHVAGQPKLPGEADLDQLSLTPVAVSFMGNKGVEKDGRGRLGFWDEEKSDLLPGAQRAGKREFDDQDKHEGKSSIVLKPQSPEHWFAVSTVNYPVPGWTDRFRFTGWARCADNAGARLAACWANNRQEVLRIDVGPASQPAAWTRLEWQPPPPPAEAATVRFAAVAHGGSVWFDDFDAQTLLPQRSLIKVWVNQVGYDTLGPKSAVIATNLFPREDATIVCELIGENNRSVDRRRIDASGRIHSGSPDDWGWYLWRFDFSPFRMSGKYFIRATITAAPGKTQSAESSRFTVADDVLFKETAGAGVDFFFVQRCGCAVPGWHGPCHLDDARLPDGTHIDVTGGWHSAGDYNKPMWQFGDSAAVYALAVAFDAHRPFLSQSDRDGDGTPDALDEAHWGAKFLAKMQNPQDGSLRGDVNQGPKRDWMRWTAPDVHTDNKIGTADDPVIAQPVGNTPLAIAGWARLAPVLRSRNVDNDYLERAAKLWEYYVKQEKAVENGLLLFGAVEMHAATGEARYKEFADRAVDALIKSQRSDGSFTGDSGDHGDWTAAALATYALKYPSGPKHEPLRSALRKYLEFCLSRADNAFGVSRQGDAAGKQLYFHPSVGLGVNFWLLGRAWAAALIHQLTGDPRAFTYAVDQIDWVFGKNPAGLCMFEGKGVFNPPRYHHRYNMIAGKERGAVPGAIPNGFVTEMGIADRAGFDFSAAGNRAPSFRTSEPWLVHNIVHLLAVSALQPPPPR